VKNYNDPHGRGPAARRPRWSKNKAIGLGAAGVIAAVVGAMILLGNDEPAEATDIVWVAEKTTRAPGGMPESLRARLNDLGAQDGGRRESEGGRPYRSRHDHGRGQGRGPGTSGPAP
jgi:hypothetical protein